MVFIRKRVGITYALLMTAALITLSSCGGGGSTTVGIGGSGIGGTGITKVRGNITSIGRASIGSNEINFHILNVAYANDAIDLTVVAQASSGIIVSGGGRSTLTDSTGQFTLNDVDPSDNFLLTLVLQSSQQIIVNIGTVSAGKIVTVNDIVVSASQGTAKPTSIDVKDNDEDDDGSNDDDKDDDDKDDKDDDDKDDEEK